MPTKYRDLFDIFYQNEFVSSKGIEAGLTKVLSDASCDDISPADITVQRKRISGLFYKMKIRWDENHRMKEKVESKHQTWLDTDFILPAKFHLQTPLVGRPKKSERAKLVETKQLRGKIVLRS